MEMAIAPTMMATPTTRIVQRTIMAQCLPLRVAIVSDYGRKWKVFC